MPDVFEAAVKAAKENGISTIVVASTTGKTALGLSELVKREGLRMIVVTHDEGRVPQEKRFSEETRSRIVADGFTVYTHNPRWILLRKIIAKAFGRFGFPRWHSRLREGSAKYGAGIKVCHIIMQMLIEGGILKEGRFAAVAGRKSGSDSVAIFSVKPQSTWPILEKVIVKSQ